MTLDTLSRFLNSTFVITLLSGALAATITNAWQSKSSHNVFKRAVLEPQLQDRRAVATEFANGFGGSLHRFNDLPILRLWIAKFYTDRTHVYPDGRDNTAERTVFEALDANVYSHAIPESLADRIAVTFSSPAIQSSVYELLENFNQMIMDEDQVALARDFDKANRYQEIIPKMQVEIATIEKKWEESQ